MSVDLELLQKILHLTFDDALSLEKMLEFANDAEPLVRQKLARRKELTKEIFDILGNDVDPIVRRELSKNNLTPEWIIVKLLSDESERTRELALEHANCPKIYKVMS
jgi:hypothetical protein